MSYEGVFPANDVGELILELDKGDDSQIRFSGIEIFSLVPDIVPEQAPIAEGKCSGLLRGLCQPSTLRIKHL